MLFKPFKFLSSFVVIIFLLTVIAVTYDSDYLPEPIEDMVFDLQEIIEDTSDALDDLFNF